MLPYNDWKPKDKQMIRYLENNENALPNPP